MARMRDLIGTVAAITAATLALGFVGSPASAAPHPNHSRADSARQVSRFSAPSYRTPQQVSGRYVAEAGGVRVDFAGDSSGVFSVKAQGHTLRLTLPRGTLATPGQAAAGGSVAYGGADGTDYVAQVVEGGIRMSSVIESPAGAHEFSYSLASDSPKLSLARLANGAVAVSDGAGRMVGFVAAPWAKDANGKEVATRYAVSGRTIVQTVDVSASTAFPVVADPTVYWWGVGVQISHATTQKIIKVLNAGGGAAGVAAALQAAGVITAGSAIATGIAAAALVMGSVALDLCDWNDRGIILGVLWNGLPECLPR